MVNAPEAMLNTNTLILVPKPSSSAPLFAALRPHFEKFGLLRVWAPLLGLGRLIAVYELDDDAADAKYALDRSIIAERIVGSDTDEAQLLLRVYAGPRTPESLLSNRSLRKDTLPVPVSDKNFLISPPGSPPVGWEQIREDPPNVDTLADDLMRALESLGSSQVVDTHENDAQEEQRMIMEAAGPCSPRQRSPRDTLIIAAPEDDSLPCVTVSNLDADDPLSVSNGLTIANTPNGIRRVPTPRPPGGGISAVRATVDSMNGRITPTARPPLNGH